MTDPRIEAIRQDPCVGRGSCSNIDECYGDSDLMELFERENITDPKEAVKVAREIAGLFMERQLDCRWGESGDAELEMWNEWKELLKNNPL